MYDIHGNANQELKLTSRTFLVYLDTELSRCVGLETVTVDHGIDLSVKGHFLGTQVRILIAVTLVTLDTIAWNI